MSQSSNRSLFLEILKKLFFLVFRLFAYLFGYMAKFSGMILEKIGQEILNALEK
jgi:hypothetical protein